MNLSYIIFSRAVIVTCLVAMIFVLGCRGSLGVFQLRKGKTDATKSAMSANREAQVKEASKHVYATGLALSMDTNPVPSVCAAIEFNDLAQATLGVPDVHDVATLKEMVSGLLSTNAQIKARAEKQKAALQADVVQLQTERDRLQTQLKLAESKRDEAYQEAAEKAAIYEKWRRRLFVAIGIIGGGILMSILLPALSTVFPVLAPFSAVFTGTFGTLARSFFKIAPQAMSTAGVVAQSTYNLADRTARDLVTAIEDIKKADPALFEQKLSPVLKDKTSSETSRIKITQILQQLNGLDSVKT